MWFSPKDMLWGMFKQRVACFFGFHDRGHLGQAQRCLFCQTPLRPVGGQVIPLPMRSRKETNDKTG